ncbi:MAG: hypothetical protein QHJ73_07225, partial [Armatimonadota bacterium]|nr:hypothetical protein [Armatimonadota bacterium]
MHRRQAKARNGRWALAAASRGGWLALVLLVGAWGADPLPAAAPEDAGVLRVGLRQGLARCELACAAGICVENAEGADLLAGSKPARVSFSILPLSPAAPPQGGGGAETPVRATVGTAASAAPAGGAHALLVRWKVPENSGERQVLLPLTAVNAQPADGETPIETGWGRYRGALMLVPNRGAIDVVNRVPIELYLRSVLPS